VPALAAFRRSRVASGASCDTKLWASSPLIHTGISEILLSPLMSSMKDLALSLTSEDLADRTFGDRASCEIVLDLDHTLINSFEYGEYLGDSVSQLTPFLPDVYQDESGRPELFHGNISNVLVIVKLRPSARGFIECLSKTTGAKLHVYTKGVRLYMDAVLSVLDPTGDLINGCRFSRDDETSQEDPHKHPSCLGFPPDTHIIVVDDSPHVWPAGYTALTVLPASRYDFTERFVGHLRSGLGRASGSKRQFPLDLDDYLREEGLRSVVQAFYAGRAANEPMSPVDRSASTTDNSPASSETSWLSAASAPGWLERISSLFY